MENLNISQQHVAFQPERDVDAQSGQIHADTHDSMIGFSSKRKWFARYFFILPFVAGIVLGCVFSYLFYSQQLSQFDALKEQTAFTVDSPLQDQLAKEHCGIFHDVGYVKGLSGLPIDNPGAVQVPPLCQSIHDKAYEDGKQSARVQYVQSYDTHRRADLIIITNAIYQYASENNGVLPVGISEIPQEIGIGPGKLNLITVLDPYIGSTSPQNEADFPVDPEGGSLESTGYLVYRDSNGHIVGRAKSSVNEKEPIVVTR